MQKAWVEKLPRGTGNECYYANTDRTKIPKICIRDFECWHCGFYQWLEEVALRNKNLSTVSGSVVKKGPSDKERSVGL
jgi:hypothetical protein